MQPPLSRKNTYFLFEDDSSNQTHKRSKRASAMRAATHIMIQYFHRTVVTYSTYVLYDTVHDMADRPNDPGFNTTDVS